MTGNTLGLAMLAKQLVFGLLVMIKNDFLPALVIVASLTFGTEFSLVPFFLVIVLFVTGNTVHLQLVLVQVTLVAVRTFGIVVFAS